MAIQDLIYDQAVNLDERSDSFGDLIDGLTHSITSSVLVWLSTSLEVKTGIILPTANNYFVLQQLPGFVKNKLDSSLFLSMISAFVSSLSEEKEFAEKIYAELIDASNLPKITQNAIDTTTLEYQGKIVASALLSLSIIVQQEMHQVGSKAVGASWENLTFAVSKSLQKLSTLRYTSKDQAMSFFRLAVDLLYRQAEKLVPLVYVYSGVRDNRNRPKCADWLDLQKAYWTRKEISELDNGQGTDVFLNGGGYGCRHWWLAKKKP